MEKESWFVVIALGIASVLLFAFLFAAVNLEGKAFGFVPSKYVYYFAAVLAAIAAFVLYIYIFYKDTGDHTGNQINVYYIVTIVGIFAVSWLFFSLKPSWIQTLGIAIVVFGLILFSM